jgi:hypothetical protein
MRIGAFIAGGAGCETGGAGCDPGLARVGIGVSATAGATCSNKPMKPAHNDLIGATLDLGQILRKNYCRKKTLQDYSVKPFPRQDEGPHEGGKNRRHRAVAPGP